MILRLFCVCALAASAQTVQPAFEVATVKLNDHSDPRMGSGPSVKSGKFMAGNLTLKRLISYAYDVQEFQMKGPGWLESEHFDVAAELPEASQDGQAKPMLRTLLEDRFRLKTHRETAEMNIYALVVGKGGSKVPEIHPGEPVKPPSFPPGASMMMSNGPIAQFIGNLAPRVGRPIVDKTELKGEFHVVLSFAPDSAGASPVERSGSFHRHPGTVRP